MKKQENIPISCNSVFCSAAFGIHPRTLSKWIGEGCPRNDDGTFSLPMVYQWRLSKAETRQGGDGSARDRKIEKDIEWREAQIQKIKEAYIERSLHETILCSRAGSLRRFLEKSFVNNAVYLVGKNVDEMRALLLDLATQCMDVYVGKRRPISGGQG